MDYKVRIKILRYLSSSLVELTWGGVWYLDDNLWKDYSFPEDIQFTQLKTFTLSVIVLPVGQDFKVDWITPLKAVRGVTILLFEDLARFLRQFLNSLASLETRNLFSNLREVWKHVCHPFKKRGRFHLLRTLALFVILLFHYYMVWTFLSQNIFPLFSRRDWNIQPNHGLTPP